MAKNSLPMMSTGGSALPKLTGVLITLAVLTLIVKHPAEAANWATNAFAVLGTAVEGLATFLSHVFG